MTMPLQSAPLVREGEPQALVIVGVLALLLTAAIQYRNPMAALSWAANVMILVFVGLFGLGIELFWLSVVGTAAIVVAGLVVRWSHG